MMLLAMLMRPGLSQELPLGSASHSDDSIYYTAGNLQFSAAF